MSMARSMGPALRLRVRDPTAVVMHGLDQGPAYRTARAQIVLLV